MIHRIIYLAPLKGCQMDGTWGAIRQPLKVKTEQHQGLSCRSCQQLLCGGLPCSDNSIWLFGCCVAVCQGIIGLLQKKTAHTCYWGFYEAIPQISCNDVCILNWANCIDLRRWPPHLVRESLKKMPNKFTFWIWYDLGIFPARSVLAGACPTIHPLILFHSFVLFLILAGTTHI